MGLDIYIYRLTKPELEDRIYFRSEIETLGLSYSPVCRTEGKEEIFQEAFPYTIQRMVSTEYINLDKLIEAYRLPKNAYIGMICGSGITVCGIDENNSDVSQDVTRQEIDAAYTMTKTELSYVWMQEEIAYWRKAFEVRDFFCETIQHHVVNTGYHLLDEDDIRKFTAKFENTDDIRCIPANDPSENSALFYHEWY